MKHMHLVLSRIAGYFRERKLLMALYISSYILCVLVFLYVYNNFMPFVTREARNESIDRYYSLDIEESVVDASSIISVIEKYDPAYIIFNHETTEGITIRSYYKDDVQLVMTGGKVKIGDYDGNYLVFPEQNEVYGYQPAHVTLEGREYTVAAYSSLSNEGAISMQGYIDNDFTTSSIEIYLNQVLSYEKSGELVMELSGLMELHGVQSPENMIEDNKSDNFIAIVSISLGFLVMMLVFGFLVKYIIQTSKREDGIYFLVGAAKGEVIGIIFLEHIIINLALSLAAVILHLVFYDPVFNKINFYDNIHMSFADYFIVVALTSILSFIIILPHLIKSYRSSVVAFRRT